MEIDNKEHALKNLPQWVIRKGLLIACFAKNYRIT